MSKTQEIVTTGRRKDAVARVRVAPGAGKIEINGRPFEEYFPMTNHQSVVLQPLQVANGVNAFDVSVNAHGGGLMGQAGAVRLAIARALLEGNEELRKPFREQGLLTRDSRMKERKKPGQPGARRRFQFSKR